MPAIEAQSEDIADEAAHYECAFHILPTVAEEEVSAVVERLEGLITSAGGIVTSEENAGLQDLAYEIGTQIEGAGRRFNAAHFCWVRFTLAPSALSGVVEEVKHTPEILRHLVIRLMRDEEENPFFVLETHKKRARAESGVAREETEKKRAETAPLAEAALAEPIETSGTD